MSGARLLFAAGCAISIGCGPKIVVTPASLAVSPARTIAAPPLGTTGSSPGFGAGTALRAVWFDLSEETVGSSLRFSALEGDTWSAPVIIAETGETRATAGRTPMIAEREGGGLVALWFETSGARRATSDDGGRTWSSPLRFAKSFGAGDGLFSWIDPGSREPSAVWIGSNKWLPWAPPIDGVLFAGVDEKGEIRTSWVLATRAVSQTGVSGAMPALGRMATFRLLAEPTSTHANEDFVVALGLRSNGRTDGRTFTTHEGWKAPANALRIGPVLAANGNEVALAWFSDLRGPTLTATFSTTGGRRFGNGMRIPMQDQIWDLSVCYEGEARVLAAWFTGGNSGEPVLFGRRIHTSGKVGGAAAFLQAAANAQDLWIGRAGDRTYATWSDAAGVHVAEISANALGPENPGL